MAIIETARSMGPLEVTKAKPCQIGIGMASAISHRLTFFSPPIFWAPKIQWCIFSNWLWWKWLKTSGLSKKKGFNSNNYNSSFKQFNVAAFFFKDPPSSYLAFRPCGEKFGNHFATVPQIKLIKTTRRNIQFPIFTTNRHIPTHEKSSQKPFNCSLLKSQPKSYPCQLLVVFLSDRTRIRTRKQKAAT